MLSTLTCSTVFGQGGTGKMPPPVNNPMRKMPPPRRMPTPLPRNGSVDAPSIALSSEIQNKQLATLDGESFKLSDYVNKVIVINLWATWAIPSRQEIPELIKIGNKYKSRGLIMLGLANAREENNDLEKVKDFGRSLKVDYKIIWDDGKLSAELIKLVNGRAVIPQTFVISRGNIVKHFQGFNSNLTPALVREAIEKNLAR
jgi:thiol-disulfide isomerase/thioredoxin